jgi:hypothetical protein
MDATQVRDEVLRQLEAYRHIAPVAGPASGVAESAQGIGGLVDRLEACLLAPRQETFELRESYRQAQAMEPVKARYWVIAATPRFVEWFDPGSGEFGLGAPHRTKPIFVSIGARGDLVSVFRAG